MRIHLLAFASAGDALGAAEREIELPEGATVAELKRTLDAAHPAMADLWPSVAVAVGEELVDDATALTDGAEVALLPPVSGGSGRTALVEGPIDLAAVAESVAGPGRGAALIFVGTVRDHHHGKSVQRITYHAYRPMAARRLEALARQLEAASPGLAVAVVHRLGRLEVGEASVVIATASPHREAAYEASRTALERLKREVPIWKRERYLDGVEQWREEEPLTGVVRPGAPTAG